MKSWLNQDLPSLILSIACRQLDCNNEWRAFIPTHFRINFETLFYCGTYRVTNFYSLTICSIQLNQTSWHNCVFMCIKIEPLFLLNFFKINWNNSAYYLSSNAYFCIIFQFNKLIQKYIITFFRDFLNIFPLCYFFFYLSRLHFFINIGLISDWICIVCVYFFYLLLTLNSSCYVAKLDFLIFESISRIFG